MKHKVKCRPLLSAARGGPPPPPPLATPLIRRLQYINTQGPRKLIKSARAAIIMLKSKVEQLVHRTNSLLKKSWGHQPHRFLRL